jgi:hypothetical protein
MKYFTGIDPVTGEVRHRGFCADDDLWLQMGTPGVLTIEGSYDPLKYYWDGEKMVDMPEKPSRYHIFNWQYKKWIPDDKAAWADIRARRDAALAKTDWTQGFDSPVATDPAWREYRKALRDITDQADPYNIQWPKPPIKD